MLNKIDINYCMSNRFNIKDLPRNENGKLKYGLNKIAIVNYIFGIMQTNDKKHKYKKNTKRKHFWNNKKYILIDFDESNIKYSTIAKYIGCSIELIKKVVQWLKKNEIILRYRKIVNNKFTNTWIFKFKQEIINFRNIFKNFRLIKNQPKLKWFFEPKDKQKWALEWAEAVQQAISVENNEIIRKWKLIENASGLKQKDILANDELNKQWNDWYNKNKRLK